jgi:hypothetical protein
MFLSLTHPIYALRVLYPANSCNRHFACQTNGSNPPNSGSIHADAVRLRSAALSVPAQEPASSYLAEPAISPALATQSEDRQPTRNKLAFCGLSDYPSKKSEFLAGYSTRFAVCRSNLSGSFSCL